MTLRDFEDLLDHCGGDPARWPPGARAQAEKLLGASARARAALAAMQAAEAWLAAGPAKAPEGLARRAMQAAQLPPTSTAARIGRPAGWAAAAVCALTLGLVAGWRPASSEDPSQILAAALGAPIEVADAN
jgi:hypothetical protein